MLLLILLLLILLLLILLLLILLLLFLLLLFLLLLFLLLLFNLLQSLPREFTVGLCIRITRVPGNGPTIVIQCFAQILFGRFQVGLPPLGWCASLIGHVPRGVSQVVRCGGGNIGFAAIHRVFKGSGGHREIAGSIGGDPLVVGDAWVWLFEQFVGPHQCIGGELPLLVLKRLASSINRRGRGLPLTWWCWGMSGRWRGWCQRQRHTEQGRQHYAALLIGVSDVVELLDCDQLTVVLRRGPRRPRLDSIARRRSARPTNQR